jgi:hypothetical protein
MADDTPGFNSLDPLGPEFGKINQPIIDQKGLSPFEGDRMQDKPINFPAMPGLNLSVPTRNVRQVAVGAPGNPANANKKATAQDIINAQGSYIKAVGQASQSKDTYAKIYSYNAGPDGNAFYKRYQAYGQEKFDEIGFSPLRDNESNFNERTTRWDDFSRMMTHSFLPLLGSGFTSGPKSLYRMLNGDFSGADLEDARLYEEAAAIGQSSKGGVFGFVNNTVMNFAYTAGIISEVILEEIGASLLAAPTGGTSLALITAKNLSRIKGIGTAMKSFKAMRNSLSELRSLQSVRNFKNSLGAGVTGTKLGRFLNPLENTFEAAQLAKADNLTGLAKGFTTAGGLYRDIRTINMAVSESRLEAGMVENSVYDDLYNEHYNLTGEAPDNKTQEDIQKKSKEASANTFYWNTGLIYATNKITFNNITGPRGGIRKFMKSVQDDFVSVGGGKFGNIGKIVYNNVAKKWAYEATNLKNLAKSWWKNPGFKTAKGTIGYFKANISEGLQENMQEIISRTNEGYYKDSFTSKARRAQEYAKGAALYGGKSQGDFFKKEAGAEFSMQGLETFGSGFFMGMLAAPLNNSIPFLSKQWNRIYDKQAYNDYVQKKERMTTGIVEVLNDIDMGEFLKSKMFNLSTQDFVNEIRSKASKKEGMDAELEGLVDSVEQMILSTNVSDVFTDHLSSYMDMTDPEFMEAMGGIEKEEIPEYKKRLTDSISKMGNIKKKYDYYKEKKPNPVTDGYLSSLDKDSDEYEEAVSLKYGWDLAVKNAVFFDASYEDTMKRMSDIQEQFLSQTTLKNLGQREMNLLFQPHKLKNEIELLKNDIEVAEQTKSTLPGAAEDLAKKKKILAQMELFSEKFKGFDLFYNRKDYYDSHREEVKKALGVDLTDEEVEKIFNDQLGKLDGEEDQAKVLGGLKESLTDYLRAVADVNEDTVFDEKVDKAFELLTDHYKLYRESSHMVRFINTLHDPGNFNDLARRNQAWMKDLYKRRAEYYDKIVRGEMEDVEFNALLNKLADFGMAITPEDFLEWKNNRTMPKEFIDIANKQIIPENSEKYYNAVDLFEKATSLRDNTTTVAPDIMDAEYNKKLAALDTAMQAEINALEQVEQRSSIGTISPNARSKTFTINKVKKETAIGDQVELTDVKGDKTVVRKDENDEIVDEAGEPVTGNKKYVSGDKFRMIMVADPAEVKAIEDRYTERKNKLKEEYLNRAATSEKPVVVDEMTVSDIMTKYPELYQQLLTAYEAMMIEDLGMEDYAAMSDIQKDNGLAKYIKSAKGRLIVDEYMEKQKITKSAQTETNEMTFTLDGTAYDTATITSVPKLRSLIKNFNKKITDIKKKSMQDAKDQEAILDFQTMINNLNLIIEKRLQGGATDELKDAIAKIKIMQKNQDGIVKQDIKSITIPEADRTWKKGDIRYTKQGIRVEFKGDNLYNIAGEDKIFNADTPNASSFQRSIDMAIYSVNPMETPNVYMIKGDQHERVSYAIKRVYDVFGLKPETLTVLNNAFDVTIGVKGFNEASVTAFIEELKAQKASDIDGVMNGFSTYTFDEIRDELLGYFDVMAIMGGVPTSTTAPNFYQTATGQIRVSTGDEGSRMVDITSEDFNKIVSQLSPEQTEKFKEYLRVEIAKTSEKLKKASKTGGYMASNSTQQNILKSEKELKETLVALESSTSTGNNKTELEKEILGNFASAEERVVGGKGANKGKTVRKQLTSKLTSDGEVIVYKTKAAYVGEDRAVGTTPTSMSVSEFKEQFYPMLTAQEIEDFEDMIEVYKEQGDSTDTIYFKELRVGTSKARGALKGQLNLDIAIGSLSNDFGFTLTKKLTDTEIATLESTSTTSETDVKKADIEKRMQYSIKEVNDNTFNGEGTYFGPNWDPNDMASIVENTQSVYGDTKEEVIDKLNQLYAKESAALGTSTTSDIEAKREAIEKRRQEELQNSQIQIPRHFTFGELGGTKGKSGKALSSIEADKNREIQEDFESKLEEGDKLIEPNGDTYYFRDGKVVKKNGQPRGMADIGAFLSGVTIDRTDKINARYAAELAALEDTAQTTTTPGAVDIEEVRKLALNTAAEQTYEASKGVGNYADAQSKRVFDGEEAVFDEEKITKEAFDALFDPKTGYLTGLKQRADKGEFFIATDIVVYGTVVDADGNTRKIAGEIDLLVADRDGKIHIIDLKTGTYGKWQGYNTKGKIGYNKRIENTLQQMSYSNLVFNQYGVETNIGILPIEAKYDESASVGKLEEASRPKAKKLFEDDDMSLLESNKPFSVKLYKDQPLQQLDADGNVVDTTAEELISKIIPRKDGKGAAGPAGTVVPDADSADDETQGGTGTGKGKGTSKRTADQKESFEIFRDRLMGDLTEFELSEINSEIFAAKMSGGITEEDYIELARLAELAESEIFMGEIPVLSVKNVKLNSKLTAKMDFTTTVDKVTTIYEAGEKVVVTEVTKDSIKVKILKDGKIVTIPDEKINDIFVETSKYDDNANDMPANMSTTYKPTAEEKIVIKETTDNITDFLSDTDGSKTAAVSKGKGMKPKDALDDLSDNVNCP